MLTVFLIVASLHFGRTLAGNLYRACPAFVLPADQLCSMLGYYTVETSVEEQEDGTSRTIERQIADTARITLLERCRFYGHILLSS